MIYKSHAIVRKRGGDRIGKVNLTIKQKGQGPHIYLVVPFWVYDKPIIIIIGTGIEKEQNIILSRCIHQQEKSKYSQQPVHTKRLISPVRCAEPDHCCCSPSPPHW
jgi:hypothetical protein